MLYSGWQRSTDSAAGYHGRFSLSSSRRWQDVFHKRFKPQMPYHGAREMRSLINLHVGIKEKSPPKSTSPGPVDHWVLQKLEDAVFILRLDIVTHAPQSLSNKSTNSTIHNNKYNISRSVTVFCSPGELFMNIWSPIAWNGNCDRSINEDDCTTLSQLTII